MKKQIITKRIIAILLAFCIFFVMMYFSIFETTHEKHKCSGQDCPICQELQVAQQIIKSISAVVCYIMVYLFIGAFFEKIEMPSICSTKERTLILDKVRIDD